MLLLHLSGGRWWYDKFGIIGMEVFRNVEKVKLSDNHSIHVIYNRPQNPSNSADTLEVAMLAQGVC